MGDTHEEVIKNSIMIKELGIDPIIIQNWAITHTHDQTAALEASLMDDDLWKSLQ